MIANSNCYKQRVDAQPNQLKTIREGISIYLKSRQISEDDIFEVVSAVDEACQNIIRHGYTEQCHGYIDLMATMANNVLMVNIKDNAPRFDRSSIGNQYQPGVPGKLGLTIIEQFMDSANWFSKGEHIGNSLVLKKHTAKDSW